MKSRNSEHWGSRTVRRDCVQLLKPWTYATFLKAENLTFEGQFFFNMFTVNSHNSLTSSDTRAVCFLYTHTHTRVYIYIYIYSMPIQWPRGLWRGSSAARLLGLGVRIQPWAWMSVCCECCVLSGRDLCDGLITRPEESYRIWCVCDLVALIMKRPWPTRGCCAMGEKNMHYVVDGYGAKRARFPFNRRLDVPQSRFWHCGEVKCLLPPPGIEPHCLHTLAVCFIPLENRSRRNMWRGPDWYVYRIISSCYKIPFNSSAFLRPQNLPLYPLVSSPSCSLD
jgi:hypothetical protein